MNPVHAIASRLVELGVSVVPIPHGTKHPPIPWAKYQRVIPSETELKSWFASDTGLGVVCGSVSGNLCALDFDKFGAYERWARSIPNPELFPTDVRGDRYHVFIRLKHSPKSSVMTLKGESETVGEFLGEGKLAVIPPSVHPSGEARRWLYPPNKGFPVIDDFDSLGVVVGKPEPVRPRTEAKVLGEGAGLPGDDFNRRGPSWAELLEAHAWTYAGKSGNHDLWKRPDKPEDGCSASTGNGVDDLLFVFSSNAAPFKADTSYSKFAAFAFLECGGDFKRAARELASKGYGATSSSLTRACNEDVRAVSHHPNTCVSLRDDDGLPTSLQAPDTAVETAAGSEFDGLFMSLPEYLLEAGPEEPDWVLEGMLPATYLVILGASSKVGKSTFATALGLAVASGTPFLGKEVKQGAVLWVAYEESEQERAMILREFKSEPEGFYVTHAKLLIDSPEGIAALRYWILKTSAKLVVIDPLYGANSAESLSDGRKARETLAGLKELCRETGVCALVLHHLTKATASGMVRERMADSNQILAVASMDLLMDSSEQGDGSRDVRLVGHGRGSFANQTWVLRSRSVSDWELVANGSSADVDGEYRDNQILDAVSVAPEGLTASELASQTGLNEGTVRNRLTVMVRTSKVVPLGKVGRANRYGPGPKALGVTVPGPAVVSTIG